MINMRGDINIIGIVILVLALIGGWFVVRSYQEKRLEQNMSVVFSDYKEWTLSIVRDEEDKQRLRRAFSEIKEVLSKYEDQSP